MSNHIADLFIIIRDVRAWLVATILLGALFWILWTTSANRIEIKEITGELLEIITAGDKANPIYYNGKVRLIDGTTINISMSIRPPVPKVGDQVPIIFERYDDGKIMYGFNNAQWISDGGISN